MTIKLGGTFGLGQSERELVWDNLWLYKLSIDVQIFTKAVSHSFSFFILCLQHPGSVGT